ncbi:chromosome segregation protein SMC [Arthrobacter sp. Soil782]|uniref:chromosome segregation protein SMC n=1 Tax=Arthrobacter sp. Soil782 TaxID=1736410 RepID=UPI0006F377B6|nr:chromosome segregation protein SMC [Arthrobacter sp. Soil782]KRF05803.1 chromosome segregation protein SMC [Arthrobacter sp. Soil782]
MHLKSLTVRGFKSFASATTFDFEPGVTAVVGPNGSGKSNVVDALAWVMGEQGAKTLRGGKMEDVIFAGTSGRPPLGRAQVSLTIDNADGALPIEYSEVTISRTLFRAGGSEYAINGNSCRLLDIQELLSDSGLGREMHVIVGQGQLDRVLHATPEDRRGFIEEAAGILKHRRRKEKTVRKLEAMQANLTRLTDLTGELRRQLTPLGKQADIARRAQQVQFEARDARARLLADDLVQLTSSFEQEIADETALKQRRAEVESLLEAGRSRQAELEGLAAEATPRLNAARDTWYRLSSARERFRSLGALAEERRRLLGSVDPAGEGGRDPAELDRQAAVVRAEETELHERVAERSDMLEDALEQRAEAEDAAVAEEQRLASLLRAASDRREGLAKLSGQVGAARSRVEAAEAELGRLRESVVEVSERRRRAQSEFTALESQVAGAEEGEEGLDADYEEAGAALDAVLERLEDLKAQERSAERERGALQARLEALRLGLERKDGSRTLLAAGMDGVLGPVAGLLTVEPGYEAAIAAALGSLSEGVAVESLGAAGAALQRMKDDDAGRVELLVAGPEGHETGAEALPDGARAAASLVTTRGGVDGAVRALLAAVVVVESLADAADLVQLYPSLTAVTREGDVYTAVSVRGGTAAAPGTLEIQAAVDEATEALRIATERNERARFGISAATAQRQEAQERADAALERLHESDARLAAVAEKLGQLGSVLRSASGEAERLTRLAEAAEENLAAEQGRLEEIAQRLAHAQDAPADAEPDTQSRDMLALAATHARQAEMEARLALRSAEEQLRATASRAASLERAAQTERAAREQAAERARIRRLQSAKAAAVGKAVHQALAFLDVSVNRAGHARNAADQVRSAWESELAGVRTRNESLMAELAELTDSVHRDELARAQQRLRIEALQNRAIDELGLTADHLVAEFGPDQPVPSAAQPADKWAELHVAVDDDGNDIREGVPYVRGEQEKRLKRAERDLSALGKVNPLALEEFAALEERHQFLSTQLEDLKATRKDLLDIIREVDERVEQVFTAAYRDTAEQFERVFGRLFPGGEGRLVLTDPEDMLTTGIEVEARPAGKKIKRLSLLSGGERSLTAVALLVAIFKARPSPFYVMDEVEAALDDTNLGRLITIFEELRESSQLIVITHQKRTMEVADALYGVTMRGDGVSTVISQRLVDA